MRRTLARVLDRVREAAVAQDREPLEREGGARHVPHELLACDVVVRADAHGCVKIEAVEGRGLSPSVERGLVVVARRFAAQIDEEATLQCDAGAGFDGGCLGRRRRGGVLGEPARHAVTHLDEDLDEVLGGRRGRADEDGRCAAGSYEDAIEDQHMEMERWTWRSSEDPNL